LIKSNGRIRSNSILDLKFEFPTLVEFRIIFIRFHNSSKLTPTNGGTLCTLLAIQQFSGKGWFGRCATNSLPELTERPSVFESKMCYCSFNKPAEILGKSVSIEGFRQTKANTAFPRCRVASTR